MPHSLPQDVRWIRRRRHATLAHGGELTTELPLWAFSAATPRPLRLLRRFCYVLIALTLAAPFLYGGVSYLADDGWTWMSIPDLLRVVASAAVLSVVAIPVRTGWMLLAMWILPVLYVIALPMGLRLIVPVWLPLFLAYYAGLLQPGLAAWFRRDRTLVRTFAPPA